MLSPTRALTLSALALSLAAALPAQDLSLGERRMNLPARNRPNALPGHDRADLRRDWNRYFFGGEPTLEYLEFKGRLAAEEMARQSGHHAPAVPGSSSTWVNLGPTANLTSGSFPDIDTGRPVDIATHPTNPQILYVAMSGGGVFKCTNADLNAAGDWTWTPITDNLPTSGASGNVSVGALALSSADPTGNTLFLGLGDAFDAQGLGLYRTTNGGGSWTAATGMGSATRTYDILPASASVVLVGTNDGLKRSTDGGATFTAVSLGGSTSGLVWSVQGFNATELICTREDAGGVGTLWYSSDAGATWTLATASGLTSPGRITVATSAASASQAWGIYENTGTGKIQRGLLSTSDKGHSWTFVTAPTVSGGLFQGVGNQMSSDGSQAFYNHGLAVDPTNANRVFVGSNLALYRTENGGTSWDQLTHWYANRHVYAHADFHCSAWSKTGPSTLFIGSDGGLCIVRNPAIASASIPASGSGSVASDVTFIDNRRNRGLTSHLIYNIGSTLASSPADSRYRISLGMQDNGTRVRQDEGGGLQNSGTFEDGIGGDGFGTVFHRTNGNLVLGTVYYTQVFRSTNGGTSFGTGDSGIAESGSGTDAPFAPTLALGNTANPDTVYTWVFKKVYKSTNFASSWTAMNMTGFDTSRSIRNVTASASDANAVAVVTSGGTGFVTYNGGSSWTQFGTLPNHGTFMSYVWFDTSSPATLYAASTAVSSSNNHLWKSTNSGATWTAIDGGGFPSGIPVYVVQNDPTNSSTLLAGTDFGVYRSDNGGSTWSRYGQGLPMVAVRDLYIAPDGSFVRAATYGRGVWEISGTSGPAAPTLTSFTPGSGPVATPVTLTGTNFTGATAVAFNGTAATFTVNSPTSIATSVPAGATTGPISVTTPGGTAFSSGSFTVGSVVSPPTINSFTASPAAILTGGSSTLSWSVTGATSLSISGLGGVSGSSVNVSPTLTTTYTLTATNSQGTVNANATVTVKTKDLDGSGGSADVLDMAVMSRAYSGPGTPTSIPAADLDGDGDVDDADIALFLTGF